MTPAHPNGSATSTTCLPPIRERLAGQRLLVTGVTGFLAKAFVEKLLRSVDTLDAIYLLIRPGRDGLSPRERLQRDVLRNRVFDRLRALRGPAFQDLIDRKVFVVSGDLTRERLGLSEDDYADLTRRITLIVNSAATVTFDERLDWALDLNTQGPRRLLQFAHDCGNIPLLHVSTCYVCGTREGVVVEDFSAPERARESLPRISETGEFDFDRLLTELHEAAAEVSRRWGLDAERCRQELIDTGMQLARRHGWNDTYTFTKWIGEQILRRDRGSVSLVIYRPAIIEGSWDEPLPGWIDGLRMADPVIVAYGKGKLGRFPGRADTIIDLIPVDFVANGMVASLPVGWGTTMFPPVVQCATSDRRPLFLGEMIASLQRAFRKRPMSDDRGRPVLPKRLRLVDTNAFIQSWRRMQRRLGRYDAVLKAMGVGEGRARRHRTLSRQIDQILYFAKIYAPYTYQNRRFAADGLRQVEELLPPEDRAEFPFSTDHLDWDEYIVDRHVPGVRSFVLGGSGEAGERLRASAADAENRNADAACPSLDADTLFEMFHGTALLFPDKPALRICRDGQWLRYTYQEALEATGSLMQRFQEQGLVPGHRVALCSENGPEWGLVYLAAMRAGFTVVPLDPQLPPSDAWEAARFAGVKLLCAGTTTLAGLSAARRPADADIVALREPFVPPPGASRDSLPSPVPVQSGDIASILFTSGTTVTPRAVPLTHANLISNARALTRIHAILPADEFLSVLPLYHVFEFMAGFVVPMACGATVTYVEQLKGPEILSAMQSTGTTIMLVVPRLLQLFHDSIERGVASSERIRRGMFQALGLASKLTRHRFARAFYKPVHAKFGGRLRMFVSGGSRLDPALAASFQRLGFTIHEGYGMTETSPVLTVTLPGQFKPGSVGPPLPSVDLEVRARNLEGIGEVWVRGPGVMSGYLHNEEATREVLVDGWLRTGDLGRLDDDGSLFLTGRSKDLIITSAGKNVYPDELEVRYRELPFVKELCVFGVPSANGMGDEVHAVVQIDGESTRDMDRSSVEREIRLAAAAIGDGLPSHQRIGTLHCWDRELPKTSTLKAKRGVIRALIQGDAVHVEADGDNVPRVRPSSIAPVEKMANELHENVLTVGVLRRILSSISKRPPESIQANMHLLLDLGIDSIGKIDVLSSIEAQFGFRIDDESGAKAARVQDLLSLIGHRQPLKDPSNPARGWRRWIESNGRAPGPEGLSPILRPARWALHGLGVLFLHSYIRVRCSGIEHLPTTGAFIIAPNHSSHLDAPAVLAAVGGKRRVWVAAAEDYFFNSVTKRWVFGRLLDAIAFDRKASGLEGLKRCAAALDRGDGLLIFPEGTRSLSGRMQPFRMGVAALAIEQQVPIVPAYVDQAFELLPKGRRWPRPGSIRVIFGAPIQPRRPGDETEQAPAFQALTRQVESAVSKLGTAC